MWVVTSYTVSYYKFENKITFEIKLKWHAVSSQEKRINMWVAIDLFQCFLSKYNNPHVL